MVPIINPESPDGEKILIAVVGDGYAANEIGTKYKDDVNRLIVNGVFGEGVFKNYKSAFKVYRVDKESHDSGISSSVTTPVTIKNTLLGLVYNGRQESFWFTRTDRAESRLPSLFGTPGYASFKYFIVIANNDSIDGGYHPGGTSVFVSNKIPFQFVSHELGHALAGLLDEYVATSPVDSPGSQFNERNCSRFFDPAKVVWKDILSSGAVFPSDEMPDDKYFSFDNRTVGMFSGCDYRREMYRPMRYCRMKLGDFVEAPFCKVCQRLLEKSLSNLIRGIKNPLPVKPRKMIHYALQLSGNKAEIISAEITQAELNLTPQLETPSDYLFEVKQGSSVLKAGFLSEDPFIARSYPPQGTLGISERILPSKTVRVTISIPLSEELPEFTDISSIQLYKLNEKGGRSPLVSGIDTSDKLLTEFNKFKKDGLVDRKFVVTNKDIKSIQFTKSMN